VSVSDRSLLTGTHAAAAALPARAATQVLDTTFSILGALPFALLLPHANLFWTGILAVLIAMIMASAFSAILVYAQELLPGRVGLAAGMFYGFSFGLGGLGAAALGKLADLTSIATIYRVCPFLLLLGLLTAFLPRRPGAPSIR
jgi:FSR family fosmidomycin resistance protein-like MFS transporter